MKGFFSNRGSARSGALVLALVLAGCSSGTPPPAAPTAGAKPAGSLLIVGGGPIPDVIVERLVTLAGGPGKARIVIFPMASEYADSGVEMAEACRKLGAAAERVFLTHAEADTEAAARKLDGITGIWFGGGDQVKLTAALLHTRVQAAIEARYRAGAVVGGTSAGAAVMTTPMITGDERHPGGSRPPEKDSGNAFMTIARDNVVTEEGFALLPGVIVDQHHVRRRRNNRLLSLVLEHPTLVGIGIDESTALEVSPSGVWRVIGDSVAVVYDARKAVITAGSAPVLGATGVRVDVLPPGATYGLESGFASLPTPRADAETNAERP